MSAPTLVIVRGFDWPIALLPTAAGIPLDLTGWGGDLHLLDDTDDATPPVLALSTADGTLTIGADGVRARVPASATDQLPLGTALLALMLVAPDGSRPAVPTRLVRILPIGLPISTPPIVLNLAPYAGPQGPQGVSGAVSSISTDPDNRLTTGADGGLYLPELAADPLAHYLLARG